MTVCIQYSRPSSGKEKGEVFGLDVAVNNLLSAYFRHGTQEKFVCRPTDMASFEHFKELAKAAGHGDEKCVGLDPRYPKQNLETVSCLFRPDPLIADPVWRRRQLQGPGFATCGLVHTMSGERIANAVSELCVAPTNGADALICPSESIRDAVQNLWQIYADYLNFRFGSKFKCPVQTPVIPLGIDTDKFAKRTTPEKRASQRQALGIAEDEIVILFVGRLSFATKAHPLALFMAAEKAAKLTRKKLRIVMFGYFKPNDMEPHFKNLAADVCKTARVDFIMNSDVRFPEGLWAAADIFTSLADNIQESFGLTPIEAMASGLPAVISDWNGYKGSVRDGLDGFLIPTLAPPSSAGMAIAEAYYNEGNYGVSLMGAAQSTAVDIEKCAVALRILAEDDAKRKSFGEQGRTRAQNIFDWRHIIKAYEALWTELAQKRRAMPGPGVPDNWQAMHPSYPNPYKMFASFPTATLAPEDRLHVVMSKEDVPSLLKRDMNFFLPDLLVPENRMIEMVEAIRGGGAPRIADILAPFPPGDRDRVLRCLGWMLKHGICVAGQPQ
jgi:glycosyltransferase involved in cell wall biosynthesis